VALKLLSSPPPGKVQVPEEREVGPDKISSTWELSMYIRYLVISVLFIFFAATVQGCSKEMIGGAAVGAAGVGAAYEYQNKKQMDRLEEDFKAGNISKEEYLKRKEDIKSGSIIY
jgi:uncharacterized oligopeptide transporter (OPT) family protein